MATTTSTLYKRYFLVRNGSQLKAAVRDLTLYPDTDQGDLDLLNAVNSNLVLLIDRPTAGAVVGTIEPPLPETRADFTGQPMIKDRAPRLSEGVRSLPRMLGNNYRFAPQLAKNTVLHKRIPVFANHPKKVIIYPGGLYANMDDNDLLGRGWTHVSESQRWKSNENFPTQFPRAISRPDYGSAQRAANRQGIAQADRDELLAWAGPVTNGDLQGPHVLLRRDSAARIYAIEWVNIFEEVPNRGGGVEYFSVNHESFTGGGVGDWANHDGMLTRAIIEEMESRLKQDGTRKFPIAKSMPYDFSGLASPFILGSDTRASGYKDVLNGQVPDPDNSVPLWLHFRLGVGEPYKGQSRAVPLNPDPVLSQLLRAGKAYAGSGRYMQHTFDDQSLFEKNPDGSFVLESNGWLRWRTDRRNTTIFGEECPIYEEDTNVAMKKLYGFFCEFYALPFFRAGSKHLPMSTDRANGWDNLQFSGQFRLNTEVASGLNIPNVGAYNRRPLNPNWAETHAISMYLGADYIMGWSEGQSVTEMGAASTNDGQSRGCLELCEKGFQRAANLNWIFDTPYQHVEPMFWLFEQATNEAHQFWNKPYLKGGIATYLGKPTIWQRFVWPCQDVDKTTEVLMWVDKGQGPITGSYRLLMKGREDGLDWWHLPESCVGIEPKHIYYQFNSLKGEKITWRGDYREERITVHPTPPAAVQGSVAVDSGILGRVRRRYANNQVQIDIQTIPSTAVPQIRNKYQGEWIEWFDAPVNDFAQRAEGYGYLRQANIGGPGSVFEMEIRMSPADTNVVSVYYTIPPAGVIDEGSILYSNNESDLGMWQIDPTIN